MKAYQKDTTTEQMKIVINYFKNMLKGIRKTVQDMKTHKSESEKLRNEMTKLRKILEM